MVMAMLYYRPRSLTLTASVTPCEIVPMPLMATPIPVMATPATPDELGGRVFLPHLPPRAAHKQIQLAPAIAHTPARTPRMKADARAYRSPT